MSNMFSKRLIEIASLVPTHSHVIDVGCDHALLDIYLTINRHCKCIASDISENCLDKAKANIKKFKLEKEIELIQSNGLENIEHNNKDVVVIAGMGTNTILEIIDSCQADTIVVQTNTDLFDFREAVTDNFEIIDEKVLLEKKIYYVIMKLKRGKGKCNFSDYLIGPVIKNKKGTIYKEYRKYLLDKNNEIYNNIPLSFFNISSLNKKLEIKTNIRMLKKYCK